MRHILHYPQEQVGEEMLETSDTLLEELAEEAKDYLELLERLRANLGGYERDKLEGDLYASISHLKSHSTITLECLDELAERLPEDEEIQS